MEVGKLGLSLYYEAKRENQIAIEERTACDEIINRYSEQYPFEEKYEDFVVFEVDKKTDTIFSGAIKLPHSEIQFMFDVANYWLKCLTEITKVLVECRWKVMFEEVDLIFDEKEGWRFPSDEEYQEATLEDY